MRERCFAQRIHVADGGAAAQQRPRHRLLLGKRDARGRRDPVGRGAAGQQHQHEVVRARRFGKRQRPFGSLQPRFVRHRMAGLDDGNMPGRAAIAVAGDGDAGEPVRGDAAEIMLFGGLRHRARRLAGGQHDEAAARRRFRQVRRQALRRVRGGDRGPEQRFEQFAR